MLSKPFPRSVTKRRRCSLANHASGWWVGADGSGQLTSHFREDISPSEWGEGSLTIEVHYSALNYKDALALEGRPGVIRKPPIIPGIDIAGVVRDSKDPLIEPGTSVVITGFGYGENRHGGLATVVTADARHVVVVPETLTLKQAAALGTAGITAGLALSAITRHGLSPSQGAPLAVTGAAGGVGSFAIALARRAGFAVTAITGRTDESSYLTSLGATEVLSRQEFLTASQRPLLPERFAGAIDQAGGVMLSTLLASTRAEGVVAACGLAGSSDLPTTVLPFILRGITLVGINSVYQPLQVRQELWDSFAALSSSLPFGDIVHEIGLTDALEVAPDVLAGLTRGRVVVRVKD
ncbi:MAG: hypothetical protein RL187_237 [Actinomycetota bacterium]